MISIITKTVTAEVYRFYPLPKTNWRVIFDLERTRPISLFRLVFCLARRIYFLCFYVFYFFQEGKHVICMCAYRSVYLVVFFAGTLHKLVVGREEGKGAAGKARPWGGRGFEERTK